MPPHSETIWNDADFTQRLAHANWMSNVAVQIHLNARATGDPGREWLGSWARPWMVTNDTRVLVLGCGDGWLERSIAHWPFIASIHAVDFAAAAVERARALAPSKVTYAVVDLNHDELPPAAYDVVIAHSVLHHVENLEHAYAQIERAMRPAAMLIINEYVGPNRFQYSNHVLEIVNALLQCLPGGGRRTRPTVEEMIANDPTEAVRAEELVALTERHFQVVDRRCLGGTILQHLLYEIAGNFRFEVPRERSTIETLCTIEAMLIDQGIIPCDFMLMAAHKKNVPPPPRTREPLSRSADANNVDPDPLARVVWASGLPSGGGSRGRPEAETARQLQAHHLRLLRIALASTQSQRANLFRESRLLAALERFRARGHDPWQWVESRARAADPSIKALLRTAATLAPRA